jgi:MFS family permease
MGNRRGSRGDLMAYHRRQKKQSGVAGMRNEPEFDWRTISALNAVSTMAQVGQFGIAFVMLPVWLSAQGLDAAQLGMFAASLWLGQLPGLGFAPWLCQRLGERWVIVLGLLCTVSAFFWISVLGWRFWLVGGFLSGFGLGLRWIGVEPWLYRIAPAEARGRLVGFHETLIALAPIIAPLLANFFGMQGPAIFWIGTTFTVGALLPLALARTPVAEAASYVAQDPWLRRLLSARERVFKQGVVIASVGGMMEAAVSGLFALFTQDHGMTIHQTADLLAVFGLGGLLMQYGVGWLADHRGVGRAALYCAVGTIAVCIALALPMAYALVVVAVFLLGGFITAFLTLALVAGTMTASGGMTGNVSVIAMIYTVSAVAGPMGAGAAIKASNGNALMWLSAAAASVMALLLVRLIPSTKQPPS